MLRGTLEILSRKDAKDAKENETDFASFASLRENSGTLRASRDLAVAIVNGK